MSRENRSNQGKSTERERHNRKGGGRKSNVTVFLKTFVIAFVVLTVVSLGATTVLEKIKNYNPFNENGEEYNPILEEELQLESLVDKNSPFFAAFKDAKKANVLLMGVNGGLTDTIMLVSFDMDKKHVDVISIPRDTYYERPGYTSAAEKKINAAYRKNPVNTAKAVSDVLCGIPINYYAVIEYDGVKNIVDSMGGVPMEIPNLKGKGGMYYNDPKDTPPLKIALPAGPRVLNGEEAVQFLRFRHDYALQDLDRVKAQQEFVKSAFKQSLGFNLPTVAKTVFKNVDSDITIGTALSLATKAAGITAEDINTYTIPYTPQLESPYYVYPKQDEIEEMLRGIYSIEPEPVADGTEGTGEAAGSQGQAAQ